MLPYTAAPGTRLTFLPRCLRALASVRMRGRGGLLRRVGGVAVQVRIGLVASVVFAQPAVHVRVVVATAGQLLLASQA